jgi:desulfoferrodoxin (superoxide reductase-like protein)
MELTESIEIDGNGRRWHVFEREDGSVTIYYTRPGTPAHFVVWDSLEAAQHSVQRTDFKRSPNCTCDTRPHAPWCVDSKASRKT